MRKAYFTAALLAAAVVSGCTATGNTNIAIKSTNANRSAMNSAANTTAGAANSVANTIANTAAAVTTPTMETFMKMAAQGGMAEVELGKLASTKGQNAEVKGFGKTMIADHGKANDELKALAKKKNIELPADMGSHQSTIDKMKTISGADFDKAYVDAMVDDHEEDVDAFQKQADSAADADLKAFAAKTLPTLKHHLEMIKAIQAKMK